MNDEKYKIIKDLLSSNIVLMTIHYHRIDLLQDTRTR